MESPPDSNSFTALLDRGISAEVQLATWCPSMDLLALVTVDGQLHVHRLNWQRLWWTAPEAPITGKREALAWHPDGKQLAAGLEDGTLLLLNTEDGEVLRSSQLLKGTSAVAAICWTKQAQQQGSAAAGLNGSDMGRGPGEGATSAAQHPHPQPALHLVDRARRLFRPPLPPPSPGGGPPAGGTAAGGSYAGLHPAAAAACRGGPWPQQPGEMALLAVASAAGELVLSTAGLFVFATLDLRVLLGSDGPRVLRMAIPRSLNEVIICWEHAVGPQTKAGGTAAAGAAAGLSMSRLELGGVGRSAMLLHQLGLVAVDLSSLLAGCSTAWAAACNEWETGMREVQDSCGKLAGLLRDYGAGDVMAPNDGWNVEGWNGSGRSGGGSGLSPAQRARVAAGEELGRALAIGIIGGALQQYLTTTLGEAGVKRLARAVDGAVHAVHAALLDSVAPAAELAAFRLSELRGVSAPCCAPGLGTLALQADELAAAERLALRLLLDAERLRRQVVTVGARYRSLFIWLLTLVRRVTEDQPDSMLGFSRNQMDQLGDFLRTDFIFDRVAAALRSPAASDESSDDKTQHVTAGAEPPGPPVTPVPTSAWVEEQHGTAAGIAGAAGDGPALSLVFEVLQQYSARPLPLSATQARQQAGPVGPATPGLGGKGVGAEHAGQQAQHAEQPWGSPMGISPPPSAGTAGQHPHRRRGARQARRQGAGADLLRCGSLASQLAALGAACEAALGRVAAAMAPTVERTHTWSLGPSPSTLALDYLPLPTIEPGQTGGDGALLCALCWHGCEAPTGAAQQAQQGVMLLRVQAAAGQVEGALLGLAPGESPVDAGFYKQGSVLLGLATQSAQSMASGQGAGAAPCRVVLLPEDQVQYEALMPDLLVPGSGFGALKVLQTLGAASALPPSCRQRSLPYPSVHPPLAVSAPRGVACVLVGTQRAMLLDLEEDEEAQGQQEEEEEEARKEAGGELAGWEEGGEGEGSSGGQSAAEDDMQS
ncbi:hypothetical protein N2152v2_001563 [Parachlorella kessleri]